MFLHLDCHWSISSSCFIFHPSSDSVALPLGFTVPSRYVSSSHKDQTLASTVIEESREFDAIVQLTASAQGSSVISCGAQFVSAGERC
jgi:hypothetical protein